MNSLHRLSSHGVNIVAAIHQPRQEILELIHNLLLLAAGGRIVYFGPAFAMRAHFTQMGFTSPISTNIADYVMDVLAGFIPRDGTGTIVATEEMSTYLSDWWKENKYGEHLNYLNREIEDIGKCRSNRTAMQRTASSQSNTAAAARSSVSSSHTQTRPLYSAATFDKTMWVAYDRQLQCYERNSSSTIITSYMLFGMGILVALLFGKMQLTATANNVLSQVSSSQLTFTLLVQSSALMIFSSDALPRRREEMGGVSLLPLFLGKLIGTFPELLFFAFAYTAGYFSFVKSQATVVQNWCLFLALHFAVIGLSNLISITFDVCAMRWIGHDFM